MTGQKRGAVKADAADTGGESLSGIETDAAEAAAAVRYIKAAAGDGETAAGRRGRRGPDSICTDFYAKNSAAPAIQSGKAAAGTGGGFCTTGERKADGSGKTAATVGKPSDNGTGGFRSDIRCSSREIRSSTAGNENCAVFRPFPEPDGRYGNA